jgi:predicted NUDIX family NTP pyrophosphohydrolase
MTKRSAGILMYRGSASDLRLLLVHPGGPFWASKDVGAWSIPKGEYTPNEEPLICAIREFKEELGSAPQAAGGRTFLELGDLVQPSGKVITVWAVEGDFQTDTLRSNLFEMEWPPKSGRVQSFPEVDLADWLSVADARKKIQPGQASFIDRLCKLVSSNTQERRRQLLSTAGRGRGARRRE